MEKDRKKGRRRRGAVQVDAEATLYEMGSRDVWQARFILSNGEEAGRVVRQIVEPELYTVRYLIVFLPEEGRRVLAPSSAVVDITNGRVHTNMTPRQFRRLPEFVETVDREMENAIYAAAERTPHWVEEAPFVDNGLPED